MSDLDPEILKKIDQLPPAEAEELLALVKDYEDVAGREKARTDFMAFVRQVWPGFIEGYHHRKMAEAFEKLERGEIRRLIVSLPPRHTKSEFASFLLPAWWIGKNPSNYIMMASHTAELAAGFGRRAKNLIGDEEYKSVFPDVSIAADSKASARWNTNKNGAYYAVGIGGKIAGRGADLFIIDDAHSEQDGIAAQTNPKVFDDVYDWYTSGPVQRMQPGGRICIDMTRWGKRDLVGRVLENAQNRGSEPWTYIELPAILPSGKPLWPEYWPLEELERRRDEMPVSKWNAQYMQQPTSQEQAIIKADWWRTWEGTPPECDLIIQAWDTAYTKSTRADFSAFTTWGVFDHEDPETGKVQPNLILLDAHKERLEFPELKALALEEWKEREPDIFVVEAQAAGMPLVFELRRMGIPVSLFRPTRRKGVYEHGTDKVARAHAVSDIFESGFVWAPPARWAEEVIEECADFPAGAHDDYVDTVVMALLKFRRSGMVKTKLDRVEDEEDESLPRPHRKVGYHL